MLGLSEEDGFSPAEGFDANGAFDAIAGVCADKLTPPIRADIRIAIFEGAPVVVADVPELSPSSKPCYVTGRGMYKGSFIRTGDGDRHLAQYEIDRLVEERTQPHHDAGVIEEASVGDLDAGLLIGVLARQRALHSRVFASLSDLLETMPYEEGGYVAENRGTGFQLMAAEFAAAGMKPPRAVDRPSLFSLTFERGELSGARGDARGTRQYRRGRSHHWIHRQARSRA